MESRLHLAGFTAGSLGSRPWVHVKELPANEPGCWVVKVSFETVLDFVLARVMHGVSKGPHFPLVS
jgi:hypothetical protein